LRLRIDESIFTQHPKNQGFTMHKQILCTIGLATLINAAAVAQEAMRE